LVFHEVQTDLETEGYEVWPYVLPSCGVNAPHRRDRVWFVAYLREQRCDNGSDNRQKRHIQTTGEREFQENKSERNGRKFGISEDGSVGTWNDTHPNRNGRNGRNGKDEINTSEGREYALGDIEQMGKLNDGNPNGSNSKAFSQGSILEQSNIEGQTRGFSNANPSSNWLHFPTQSPICGGDDGLPTKLDNITFSKWRNESIKAFGNAIVPQVAYQIFKAIEQL